LALDKIRQETTISILIYCRL